MHSKEQRIRELAVTIEALERRNETECWAKAYNVRVDRINKLNKQLEELKRAD